MTQRQFPSPHVRNIALDIILTLLTFGLYNLYVQAKQMNAVNEMIQERKYSFVPWLLLTLITFGLYHIYYEYRMSADIDRVLKRENSMEPMIAVVLSSLALPIVVDAIQQTHINSFFGSEKV